MRLTREQLEQLIALARADAPNETCGIIGGKDGQALRVYPIQNIDPEPRIRYNCEPHGLLNALRDIDENGWEHIAIYHSHPATQAHPSETDISRAFYPDSIYLLISLMNPKQSQVRAFRIVDGQVSEVTLEVEEKGNEPSRTNPRRAAPRTGRPSAGRPLAALSQRRPASRRSGRTHRRVSKKV